MKKIIVIILAVALFGVLLIRKANAENRMDAYAIEHNCEWSYSWYINEEPVCR